MNPGSRKRQTRTCIGGPFQKEGFPVNATKRRKPRFGASHFCVVGIPQKFNPARFRPSLLPKGSAAQRT
jgi:hypothetical protein